MGKSFSLGGVHLGTATDRELREVPDKPPLKIVILGDFSGRDSRPASGTRRADIRTRVVDRDNFEQTLAQLNPRVEGVPVQLDGATGAVAFESLDDFLPDSLLRAVPGFKALRALRRKLADRNTFAAAMEEARGVLAPPTIVEKKPAPTPAPARPAPPKPALNPEGGSLLDQVLEAAATDPTPALPVNEVTRYARQIMAPYSIPADDPRQEPWLNTADQATAFALQRLLQHPHFRALEARRRSLDWLTRRINADTEVKVAIVDISAAELRADLAADDLNESAIYQLLAVRPKEIPDDPGWQVIILDERLNAAVEDIELIGRLCQVATDAGAKLLVGLTDEAVGCTQQGRNFVPSNLAAPSDGWKFLQRLPDAARAAALWPGFLVRQPYGKETREIETCTFEELQGLDPTTALLWGNSAYLAAEQLIRNRDEEPAATDVTELACIILPEEDGEKRLVPSAGWWLRDQTFEQLNRLGVTPVCALTRAGTVRVFALRNLQGETL